MKGGGLTDAGEGAITPPDAGYAPCTGTGTHWSDLYNDVFGPTGRPGSCSYQSSCHGSADAAGAQSAAGIQCFDMKGCRQSLLDKNLLSPKDSAAPDKSGLLLGLLRIRNEKGKVIGFMPQSPSDYVFDEACVRRIKAWIADGAPDD